MSEVEVGLISDFFSRPVVAAVDLSAEINVGDKLHIKGHTTDLELVVQSMQINNRNVDSAKAGDSVGVRVTEKVRHGDKVYKIID